MIAGVGVGEGEKKLVKAIDEGMVVGATEDNDVVIGALVVTADERDTSEDVTTGDSDGCSRSVIEGTKLKEGTDEVAIGVDVTKLVGVVKTGSLIDCEKKVVVGSRLIVVIAAGVLDIVTVGLDSGKSTSVAMNPDPSSSVREMETVGVLLLMTPSVVVIVCVIVSISKILVNIPVRVGICEVVCTSGDDVDTFISGVTLTVSDVILTVAGVLSEAIVLNTNCVVGVGVIDSRLTMVLSATEGSETVSLSIGVVRDPDMIEVKNGVLSVADMVGCGVDTNAVSVRVDIGVEKTKAANPVSLTDGRKLLLVSCVVSVGEISSLNSVVEILTKDEEINGWVVGIILISDASSDTDADVSDTLVKAETVEDGTSNTIDPPNETDVETRDGETTPAVAELSSSARL